jgi:transcriptional regulator of acetoin/glycerol metabolism
LIIGCDRAALSYLGIASIDIGSVKIQQVVDITLDQVFDHAKHGQQPHSLRTHTDRSLFSSFQISDEYRHSNQSFTPEAPSSQIPLSPVETPTENLVEFGRLRELSKLAIEKTLIKTNGNISLAAKMLGISRNTLYRYLRND